MLEKRGYARVDLPIHVENRRGQLLRCRRVMAGMPRIKEVPEMVADAVRLGIDAEKEVPVLELQTVAKQSRLPSDAFDQLFTEPLILRRGALPSQIAARDGMIAETPHEVVDQRGGIRGARPRPGIVGAPVGDLDTVQSLGCSGEWRVDDGDPLSRPAEVLPERWHGQTIRVQRHFEIVRAALELLIVEHAVGG